MKREAETDGENETNGEEETNGERETAEGTKVVGEETRSSMNDTEDTGTG
jgi:hypothetical protein